MDMHLLAATYPEEAVDVSFQCVILMGKERDIRRGACRGYPFPEKATEIVVNDVSVGLWVFLVSMSCSSECKCTCSAGGDGQGGIRILQAKHMRLHLTCTT
jgi:hypothetical protein